MSRSTTAFEGWPALPLAAWSDTFATLLLWTQIVGKIRLAQSPWVNHGWHATLYPTARGLTTSLVPYGERVFQIDFDFIDHRLIVQASDGHSARVPLEPQSVAAFHRRLMEAMAAMNFTVKIHPRPNEVAEAIRFDQDEVHRAYDPEFANRYWRILVQTHRVFQKFRSRFIGKCSPVHFFWGGGDLAVTRFSGRRAPQHPGGYPNLPDRVTREAYSHEVSSSGFWPGGGALTDAVFYSYAYPEPPGFGERPVGPSGAYYQAEMREFILPYQAVRAAASPDDAVLEFLQSTYEAAADLAGWDRDALERDRDPERGWIETYERTHGVTL
jgi:hypothetical protein